MSKMLIFYNDTETIFNSKTKSDFLGDIIPIIKLKDSKIGDFLISVCSNIDMFGELYDLRICDLEGEDFAELTTIIQKLLKKLLKECQNLKYIDDFNILINNVKLFKNTFSDIKDNEELERAYEEMVSPIDKIFSAVSDIKDLVDFYFNIFRFHNCEKMKPNQKFFYSQTNMSFLHNPYVILPTTIQFTGIRNKDTIVPSKAFLKKFYDDKEHINYENRGAVYTEYILKCIENKEVLRMNCYEIKSMSDLLNIELDYIINHNKTIKKCKNCEKYFIPKNRSDEEYCYNISPQNNKKTCKEYGARKVWEQNLNNTPIGKEHYRTSQYFRMRYNRERTDENKQRINDYLAEYKKKLTLYNEGKLSKEDFVNWIILQRETSKKNNKRNSKK